MSDDTTDETADISIDITNGKKLTINLSPLEWAIVGVCLTVFASVTGLML